MEDVICNLYFLERRSHQLKSITKSSLLFPFSIHGMMNVSLIMVEGSLLLEKLEKHGLFEYLTLVPVPTSGILTSFSPTICSF